MKDFVLEIGTENLPAYYVEPAFRQLADDAEALFGELRLGYEELYATGTPRRLVLLISGLAERQEAAEEIVTGPPVNRAFDDQGKPTAAAEGFARSRGVSVGELERVTTPKGEYLGIRRRLERRRTADLMAERAPGLIGSLRFPKVMKWERSGAKFARPVRWIVCLYGSAVIRFSFAGVRSGKTSCGRPWMPGEAVAIRSASSYLRDVSRLGILVDDEVRRGRILRLARSTAARAGLSVVEDEGLVYELSFMLENPRVLLGEFPQEYLKLPREVVTTAMRSHQRYLAVEDRRGELVPRFLTFTDGVIATPALVRRGNERVLKARLDDARFYWSADMKRGIEGMSRELDRIVFIEGLGSVGEKSERVGQLAEFVNTQLPPDERRPEALIRRVARLGKADLASEMIKDGKEFTLLQGIIGSRYARECGEEEEVVTAIEEQYLPRTPGDRLPASTLGAFIGVADRMDTICGCFLAGLVPTGSQDPYGLRRQANGLVRILEGRPSVRLDRLIRRSVDLYRSGGLAAERADAAIGEVESFFATRCEAFLKERGVPYDVVAAVNRVSWIQPGVALARAREVAGARGDGRFERLVTGVKRVGNILPAALRVYGAETDRLLAAFGPPCALTEEIVYSVERFVEPAEAELQQAVAGALPGIVEADRNQAFGTVFRALSALADPIDAYFERVLVNVDDAEVRRNRHHFLAAVFAVFARYADFSFIVEKNDI